MTELVAITFHTAEEALSVRDALPGIQERHHIEFDDAAVVTRDADGRVELHQPVNIKTAHVLGGAAWGLVLGAVFLLPVAGAAVGAGAGLVTGSQSNVGLDDAFVRDFGEGLEKGGAALCFLMRRAKAETLIAALKEESAAGRVFRSGFDLSRISCLEGVNAGKSITNDYPQKDAL